VQALREEELERDYIATVLGETRWQRMQAAYILCIDRRMLYRQIRAYGLQPARRFALEA
jgi:DNA-binding NtrC family response regulator